jgi:predicted DNA-binding transcriptional regulator AlpA
MSALVEASSGLIDPLLNSKIVRRDVGSISEICLWRWTRDRGFPRPDLVLGDRKFWHRSSIENWIEAQKVQYQHGIRGANITADRDARRPAGRLAETAD